MAVIQARPSRVLQRELERKLGDLMKPLIVKHLVITRASESVVRGVLVAECPIEKEESGKDFEVGFGGENHSLAYVIVDGRRLLPKRKDRPNLHG